MSTAKWESGKSGLSVVYLAEGDFRAGSDPLTLNPWEMEPNANLLWRRKNATAMNVVS